MAQKSLNQQFPIDRRTKIDDVWLRRLLGVLESRLSGIEVKAADFDAAVSQLLAIGIDRINEVLIPAIEQVRDLTQLGFLIAGSQTAALLVEDATTIFTVTAGAQRDLFTPSAFVMLTRDANLDDWAVLRTVSYNRENGEYVGTMVAVHGGPGPFSDWTLGALAGSTVAQMDMLDESELIRDEVTQLKTDTNIIKGQTGVIRDEVVIALDATIGEKEAVEDMRDEIELDRAAVETKKADFDRVYWGRRATPPPTTGDGAAQPGALYVDTSVTPNVVKVLGAGNTWAPAVTVSIGGARQQIYIATEGQTGPFTVDGGFTTGSVNVNGAELYHGHGVTLAPGPTGTFTLATPRKAGDLIVFSGYLANDATDIFTKSESDARFQKKADAGIYNDSRNRLLNGSCSISQRGTSFTIAPGASAYTADRWRIHNDTNQTLTVQTLVPVAGLGRAAVNRLRLSFATAPTTGLVHVVQAIENVDTLAGSDATVSLRASGGPIAATVGLNQNFGSGGSATVVLDRSVNIAADWTLIKEKFTLPSTEGKTVGANNHVSFYVSLPIRSTAPVSLTRFAVVEGDATAEADPFSSRHPQQEFDLCQRYYQKYTGLSFYTGDGFLNNGVWQDYLIPQMRGTPTAAASNVIPANCTGFNIQLLAAHKFRAAGTIASSGGAAYATFDVALDAEF